MARKKAAPLADLKVIDFAGLISGGFATVNLADFGADVIMVEHPKKPDSFREWPPMENGTSLWFKSIGRNKRSITLDLSTDEGRELALDLVADADVVFENFRPGTMEQWELGYESLRAVNEEVVMVRISGYGQTGPYSEKPGYGTIAEGYSGWASANGFEDREPLLPPISLADLVAALFGVHAAMFAIYERDLLNGGSGEGQVIDVSLYEPLFRLFLGEVEKYHKKGDVMERNGNKHPNAAPRGVYETADGYITLSASSQKSFEHVMEAIDCEDLIDHPRFETNERRVENADALDEIIEAWTRERTQDDVLDTLEANDAIAGPIYSMADAFEDPHFQARDDFVTVDDPDVGELKTTNAIPFFSRTPGSVDHAAPRHGQHNEEVYRSELGLSEAEYERLRRRGVI